MKRKMLHLLVVLPLLLGWQLDANEVRTNDNCSPLFTASSFSEAMDGDLTWVRIGALNYSNISRLRLRINWDPQALEFVDTLGNPSAQVETDIYQIDTTGGAIYFSITSDPGLDLAIIPYFFQIRFRVLGDPGLGTEVSFDTDPGAFSVLDENTTEKSFGLLNGLIYNVPLCTLSNVAELCLTEPSCGQLNDGSIDFLPGGPGPYTYLWTFPDGTQSTTQNQTNLAPGIYELIYDEQCTVNSRLSIVLNGISGPQIVPVNINHNACFTDANGSISIKAIGGQGGPYQYEWNNASRDSSISQLLSGLYTVTVTDVNFCQTVESFEIRSAPELLIEEAQVRCETSVGNDGSIDLCVSGGSQPLSYIWSNGATTPQISNLNAAASPYSVTITDAMGCFLTDSYTVGSGSQILRINADTTICTGVALQLAVDAPAASIYNWTPAEILSCTDCPNPVARIQQDELVEVRVVFADGCEDRRTVRLTANDCVWPGDTDTNKVVNNFDLLNIGIGFGQSGPMRANASFAWGPQPAVDWPQSTPLTMVNYKHIDTDGDGLIGFGDTTAIPQNWGQVHMAIADPIISDREDSPPFYVTPDTVFPNAVLSLPVVLGETDFPAENVYGVAFSLTYDADKVVPGSARLSFTNSWLGAIQSDMISIQKDFHDNGQIDIAVTRIDGQNMTGFGTLAELFITIEDDIFVIGNGGTIHNRGERGEPLTFQITNVRMIDFQQNEMMVEALETAVTINNPLTSTEDVLHHSSGISIFPNPAKQRLSIRSDRHSLKQLQLLNSNGQLLMERQLSGDRTDLNLKQFPQGTYFLKALTMEGWSVHRFIIIH
ncbi:MAG: T9SS type A sorting domain-containing protein [Bacteroidota bacterium]